MNRIVVVVCLCFVIAVNFQYGESLKTKNKGKNPPFRKDYEYVHCLSAFYKVHAKARSWTDARTRCEREGGTLATPASRAEAKEMQRLMDQKLLKNDVGAFIGLYDFLSEGDFVTLEGVIAKNVYHNWANGEPDNADDNEHCVIISRVGLLSDVNCNTPFPFICKKTLATVRWNEECNTYDPEYHLFKDTNTCHKLHTNPQNWTDAYATCVAEEGYLAVINSETEERALVDLIISKDVNQIPGNYLRGALHIGFHNKLRGREFLTVFGETLDQAGYSWVPGQPDNVGGNEYCGSMFQTGELNDISCATKALFICERPLKGEEIKLVEPDCGGCDD